MFTDFHGRNIDLIICLDATYSMAPMIDNIKENSYCLYDVFKRCMNARGYDFERFRVKIISFGDYKYDENPMVESKFFTLPDEAEEFKAHVDNIYASGGGDYPENALEAIALAIRSEWKQQAIKDRQVILVITDDTALPLGERSGFGKYDAMNYPNSLEELYNMWEGNVEVGSFLSNHGRLFIVAPDIEPWNMLGILCDRCMHIKCEQGKGVREYDISDILEIMCVQSWQLI